MSSLQTHPKLDFCSREFSFSKKKLQNLFIQVFQAEEVSSSSLYQDHRIMDHFLLSNLNQIKL